MTRMSSAQIFADELEQRQQGHNQPLFAGIRLKWGSLTQAEKVVCLLILLIPLWWLWGWSYLSNFLAMGLMIYDWRYKGGIKLSKPNNVVIFAFLFGFYLLICKYFYAEYHHDPQDVRDLVGVISLWFFSNFVLWYVQSNRIRVRFQVVAWSLTVVVVQMLVLWLFIVVVLKQGSYTPARSIFAMLTGKAAVYIPGSGTRNFLMPYFSTDGSFIPGLVRYNFFFERPETFSLVASLLVLMAFDLKNRLWFFSLLSLSFFLLCLSGTRSVIIALPLILGIRYLATASKTFGVAFVLAAIALVSFIGLSVPTITNVVENELTNTIEVTANARPSSTDVRAEIYQRTWERITDASDSNLFFGHVVRGETVLPGYAPAQIGSHSFYLSTLLYRSGVIGTILFSLFWISLLSWFYQRRQQQPLFCLLMLLLFSLTFCVMEWESVVMPIILICSTLSKPSLKSRYA